MEGRTRRETPRAELGHSKFMNVPLLNSKQSKRIKNGNMATKEETEILHLRRRKRMRAKRSFAMLLILERAPAVMVPNADSFMKTELAMLVVKVRAKEDSVTNRKK